MRTKTKNKRRISLLLSAVLLAAGLCGCKKEAASLEGEFLESSTAEPAAEGASLGGKGRFLETELTLPDNVGTLWASALLEDGSIEVFFWNDQEKDYQI